MRTSVLISIFLTCLTSNVLAADSYTTYVNQRYGYRVAYPAAFLPQGVPDSGDGQVFLSPNGDAELRVFASACVEGINTTPNQYLATYKTQQKAKQLTISYQRLGSGFAVVSGHLDDRIFYDKILIHDDWCTQLTFKYNELQAAKYDAVTKRIASSLTR